MVMEAAATGVGAEDEEDEEDEDVLLLLLLLPLGTQQSVPDAVGAQDDEMAEDGQDDDDEMDDDGVHEVATQEVAKDDEDEDDVVEEDDDNEAVVVVVVVVLIVVVFVVDALALLLLLLLFLFLSLSFSFLCDPFIFGDFSCLLLSEELEEEEVVEVRTGFSLSARSATPLAVVLPLVLPGVLRMAPPWLAAPVTPPGPTVSDDGVGRPTKLAGDAPVPDVDELDDDVHFEESDFTISCLGSALLFAPLTFFLFIFIFKPLSTVAWCSILLFIFR